MRGVGGATAAVTIVNALPTGVGSAVGVGLLARVQVDLAEGRTTETTSYRPSTSSTPLVRAALAVAQARFGLTEHAVTEVTVDSEIPVGKGLKSSSAVASAVVRAVADAAGRAPPPLEIARLAAQVSRASGTSATGAFDDALAGVRSGIVVTDNRTDVLLRDLDAAEDLEVVIWAPPGEHLPSPRLRERFGAERVPGQEAVDLALQGDWPRAMAANSAIVERVMGYAYAPFREACHRRGALGAGTSGLGPAFAAIVRRGTAQNVAGVFAGHAGTVVTVGLSSSAPAVAREGG